MRKLLKIKTFTLLIAWLTIFIHNTIPHNHAYENPAGCKDLIHNSSACDLEKSRSQAAVTQPSDLKICHVSSLLFSNFNHDNLIIHFTQDIILNSDPLIDKVLSATDQSYISDHFHGTTSFRAPPMS